jgi:hypothetical protein
MSDGPGGAHRDLREATGAPSPRTIAAALGRRGARAPPRFARTAPGGYHARLVRVLLVLVLVHGLAPGLAEVAEGVVHQLATGHAAHTEADHGDLGAQGPEHGCGTTQHRCACCVTQVFTPSGQLVVASLEAGGAGPLAPAERTIASREPARPFRPPIS